MTFCWNPPNSPNSFKFLSSDSLASSFSSIPRSWLNPPFSVFCLKYKTEKIFTGGLELSCNLFSWRHCRITFLHSFATAYLHVFQFSLKKNFSWPAKKVTLHSREVESFFLFFNFFTTTTNAPSTAIVKIEWPNGLITLALSISRWLIPLVTDRLEQIVYLK